MDAILSIREEDVGVEEALRRKMSYAFNPEYMEEHPEEINQIIAWRIEEAQPRYAWLRQAEAVRSFSLGEAVSRIKAPTLIVAGTKDRVVPCRNAELLAETIPNSRLVLFEGGSHLLFIENVGKDSLLFSNRCSIYELYVRMLQVKSKLSHVFFES